MNNLHALLPIFDWNWWQIFLTALVADWGIILVIKYFEPLGWKRAFWRSSLYGDIFLPIGIASAAVVAQGADLAGQWYAGRWFNWLVFATGWLIIIAIEIYLVHPKNGHYQWKQIVAPSKLWHSFIFPFMFYASLITLIPLFTHHRPWPMFVLALLGYGVWFSLYITDLVKPPDFSKTH